MRIIRSFCLLLLLCVCCCQRVQAQYLAPKLAIHFTNPLGLFSKGGIKGEYRLNQLNSVLVGYTHYWGYFPGYQADIGYHRYYRSWDKYENFLYARVGTGLAEYRELNIYSDEHYNYVEPGQYLFAGIGIGRRYNWGPFFLEINLGLKGTTLVDEPKDEYNKTLFYTIGPGSLVDCNLHFGFTFFHEKGEVSHISGRQLHRRYRYDP